MVGRLVEYQQVDRLKQQAYHGQAASFATAEHLHLFLRFFASEHECTQNVVDAQSDVSFGHMVDGVEHGLFFIEKLCLVLGKIAYLHVVSNFQRTRKGNFVHDTFDKG